MRMTRSALTTFAVAVLSAAAATFSGCSGNPNQAEYDAHTPPGKPSDDPNDAKVSYRRDRTRNVPKQLQSKIQSPAPKAE